MVLFNYAIREITAKLVYYGPGLGGKTTNLQKIHENIETKARGKLISLATDADRTLFFDFLPIDLGQIGGYRVRFQLYTVPGQVHYNATRKLVLKGVDAIVFVADSQIEMLERNRDSFDNLKENLAENGYDWTTIPIAFQFNKQDLPNTATPEEIAEAMGLDPGEVTWFPGVALEGKGVFETLKAIIKLTITKLKAQFEDGQFGGSVKAKEKAKAAPPKTGGIAAAVSRPAEPPPVPPVVPQPVPEVVPEPEPMEEAGFEPQAVEEAELAPEPGAEAVAGDTQAEVAAREQVHEVDLDAVLAEEHARKAFDFDAAFPSGARDIAGEAEAEPEPAAFAPEGGAEAGEEELDLAGDGMLEEAEEEETLPLAEPWEQAVDEGPGGVKGGLWGGRGAAAPEEEGPVKIVTAASPDYYTMDRSEAETRALAPAEEERAPGPGSGDIWPRPAQPEPALLETAGSIRPTVIAEEKPEPAPAAAPSAADAGDIAALREHMAAMEKSLAEISGALIEQRRLMNKVIDLAVGRMFNPEEATGGAVHHAQPPRSGGFLSRLFGGGR